METGSGDALKPLRRKIYVPILNLSRIVVARLISESASYNAAAISIISYSRDRWILLSMANRLIVNRRVQPSELPSASLTRTMKRRRSPLRRSLSLSLSLALFLSFFLSSPILARAIIHKSREASILYGLWRSMGPSLQQRHHHHRRHRHRAPLDIRVMSRSRFYLFPRS